MGLSQCHASATYHSIALYLVSVPPGKCRGPKTNRARHYASFVVSDHFDITMKVRAELLERANDLERLLALEDRTVGS